MGPHLHSVPMSSKDMVERSALITSRGFTPTPTPPRLSAATSPLEGGMLTTPS